METKPPEKKGLLTKLKENVDDHEEQMAVLGAAVRLGVVIWSGFIITLSYVELPMVQEVSYSRRYHVRSLDFYGSPRNFRFIYR